MTADPIAFLAAALDEAEAVARAASGGTVVGHPGKWAPSPTGDEWEASSSLDGDTELLVALRPGLPRPPDVLNGLWGVVIANVPDDCDPNAWDPLPQLEHAALHDPAAVLRRVAADRKVLAEHQPGDNESGIYDTECSRCWDLDWTIDRSGAYGAMPWPCPTVRALAEGWGWTAPGPSA